jgi:hypothetical protein
MSLLCFHHHVCRWGEADLPLAYTATFTRSSPFVAGMAAALAVNLVKQQQKQKQVHLCQLMQVRVVGEEGTPEAPLDKGASPAGGPSPAFVMPPAAPAPAAPAPAAEAAGVTDPKDTAAEVTAEISAVSTSGPSTKFLASGDGAVSLWLEGNAPTSKALKQVPKCEQHWRSDSYGSVSCFLKALCGCGWSNSVSAAAQKTPPGAAAAAAAPCCWRPLLLLCLDALALAACVALAFLGSGIGRLTASVLGTKADVALTILSRPVFGLGLAWVMAGMILGRMRMLAWFLSMKLWTPVAGLSYGAYILQDIGLTTLKSFVAAGVTTLFAAWAVYWLQVVYFSLLCLVLALPFAVTVEVPFHRMIKRGY